MASPKNSKQTIFVIKPTTTQTCARPTLPGSEEPSTIGDASLNFRVRDGNGCDPCSIAHRFGLSLCLITNMVSLDLFVLFLSRQRKEQNIL